MSKKYKCKTIFSVLSFVAINVVCPTGPLLEELEWVDCRPALRSDLGVARKSCSEPFDPWLQLTVKGILLEYGPIISTKDGMWTRYEVSVGGNYQPWTDVVCHTKPLLGEREWVDCGSALHTNHLDLVRKLKRAVGQHIVPRLVTDQHKFKIFDCKRVNGSEFNISIQVPYGSKCVLFQVGEDGCITVEVPDEIISAQFVGRSEGKYAKSPVKV